MNNHRRAFISQVSVLAGAAALARPLTSVAAVSKHIRTLDASRRSVTIYYTNDLHGNFDAVCDDLGGLRQVEKLLHSQETSGLLLDGGDFLKSSLTSAQQQQVIATMNRMGYHAAAIGNHELANGEEYLAQLAPLMHFTLVNCNYELTSGLSRFVKPYIIMNAGNYKIGITGVGHTIKGVPYHDATGCANAVAKLLKEKEKCDLVICLSHLGYTQKGDLPDNNKLARSSEYIDMIVSGHGRTLLQGPAIALNKNKQEVVVGHAGWSGTMVGKTVFGFEGAGQKHDIKTKHIIAGQPYGQSFTDTFAALRGLEKQLA